VVIVCVVGCRAGHCRRCVHFKWLNNVTKAAAEGLDVIFLFFSPFSATILEPNL
jgi:hypothetical protein